MRAVTYQAPGDVRVEERWHVAGGARSLHHVEESLELRQISL